MKNFFVFKNLLWIFVIFYYNEAYLYRVKQLFQKTRMIMLQKALWNFKKLPNGCLHEISRLFHYNLWLFFSPFPHGTGSLSVTCFFRMEGGTPFAILKGFKNSRVSNFSNKYIIERTVWVFLRGFHLLWHSIPNIRTYFSSKIFFSI